MSKQTPNRFSSRTWRVALLGIALGAAVPFVVAPPAQAKRNSSAPRLELWPGSRVTVLLPLTLSSDWNADAQLGRAIIPVVSPELQRALVDTRKFSLTLPYRFDPILRRAVQEKRVAEADLNSYLATPTVQSVQPVMSKFSFEQPIMIADVKLEELNVGGTPQAPTVQVKVSGTLYENSAVFRRAVVTSRSYGGKTPEYRLTAAAQQAFRDLAEQFITAPPSFELPAPIVPTPTPTPMKEGATTPAKTSGTSGNSVPATNTGMVPAPVTVTTPSVAAPNALKTQPGAAFLPQLPAAQPPLGIAIPDQPAGTRE